jgi:hypothetical protein
MLNHLLYISTRKDIRVGQEEEKVRPLDADPQLPDTTKFTEHSGWEAQIPFEKTMQGLLDYWFSRIQPWRDFLSR